MLLIIHVNFLDCFGHCTQSQGIGLNCLYRKIKIRYLPHVDKYLTLKSKSKYKYYISGIIPSHPRQFNLAIILWVGRMSTTDGCGHH